MFGTSAKFVAFIAALQFGAAVATPAALCSDVVLCCDPSVSSIVLHE